jgi:hypothetical protein
LQARHYDRPLPESFATKCSKTTENIIISKFIPGQQLYGAMIPRLQDDTLLSVKTEDMAEQAAPAIADTWLQADKLGDDRDNTAYGDEISISLKKEKVIQNKPEGNEVEVGFMEDEGLEIVSTGAMQPVEVQLLRTKSLDSTQGDETSISLKKEKIIQNKSEGNEVEVGFMEDEGLEVVSTGAMQPVEVQLLRTKSLDSTQGDETSISLEKKRSIKIDL